MLSVELAHLVLVHIKYVVFFLFFFLLWTRCYWVSGHSPTGPFGENEEAGSWNLELGILGGMLIIERNSVCACNLGRLLGGGNF